MGNLVGMKVRTYKLTVAGLLCFALYFAWRYWALFGQVVWADYIDKQCRITQESFIDSGPDPEALALRLEFLMGYYDAHSKGLAGSHLDRIVQWEYQQTLTNAVAAFRRATTNDLGNDPLTWIQQYGH